MIRASEIQRGLAVGGIAQQSLFERIGGFAVIFGVALSVELHAAVELVDGGLRTFSEPENLDGDGCFLARINGFLARAIGLVAHAHTLDRMRARNHALLAKRLAFVHYADGFAIDEHLDAIHVGFDHHHAVFRRRWGIGRGIGPHVRQ